MTRDEFQRKYHYYQVDNEVEARAEADKVNSQLEDGSQVIAVEFPPFGWCLMLESAAGFLRDIEIL